MFKKIFAVMFAVLFIGSGAALACQGSVCYDPSAYRNYANPTNQSVAITDKSASATTAPWSNNTDEAFSSADGGASAFYQGYAGGRGLLIGNYATGYENTGSDSTAGAFALDFGKSSVAGAYADQKSFGNAGALALGGGLGTGAAWTQAEATVGGRVSQFNAVGEPQFPHNYTSGTFAFTENLSGAFYSGYANDQHCDTGKFVWGPSASSVDLSGRASTIGGSFVKIDDIGDFRDAYGKTWNASQAGLTGADGGETYVYGHGNVGLSTDVGQPGFGASAIGFSKFGYEGATFGKGGAEHYGYAEKYSIGNTNSARSGSNGSAFSFSVGTAPVGQAQ